VDWLLASLLLLKGVVLRGEGADAESAASKPSDLPLGISRLAPPYTACVFPFSFSLSLSLSFSLSFSAKARPKKPRRTEAATPPRKDTAGDNTGVGFAGGGGGGGGS